MKPTAQELLERIEKSLVSFCAFIHEGQEDNYDYAEKRAKYYFMDDIKLYAQTYHEEHTQGTIIDIDGQRYNAILTPYNQPNQ